MTSPIEKLQSNSIYDISVDGGKTAVGKEYFLERQGKLIHVVAYHAGYERNAKITDQGKFEASQKDSAYGELKFNVYDIEAKDQTSKLAWNSEERQPWLNNHMVPEMRLTYKSGPGLHHVSEGGERSLADLSKAEQSTARGLVAGNLRIAKERGLAFAPTIGQAFDTAYNHTDANTLDKFMSIFADANLITQTREQMVPTPRLLTYGDLNRRFNVPAFYKVGEVPQANRALTMIGMQLR